jgi:hypothetical protein
MYSRTHHLNRPPYGIHPPVWLALSKVDPLKDGFTRVLEEFYAVRLMTYG